MELTRRFFGNLTIIYENLKPCPREEMAARNFGYPRVKVNQLFNNPALIIQLGVMPYQRNNKKERDLMSKSWTHIKMTEI